MWIRWRATCKRVLRKARLCDHICCEVSGNGSGNGNRGRILVSEIFRKLSGKWTPLDPRGRITHFPRAGKEVGMT
jgi:hypothetical protein